MKTKNDTHGRLLILTDLGTVRVLKYHAGGDDPRDRSHLVELSESELGSPRGAATTDQPGKCNRGFAAGTGEAMSHAETKLDVEVESVRSRRWRGRSVGLLRISDAATSSSQRPRST